MSKIHNSEQEISLGCWKYLALGSGVFRLFGIRVLVFGSERFQRCSNLTDLISAARLWLVFGPLICLFLFGCGKKGPPIPYDVAVPRPISDLEGIVREGKVFLRWSGPLGAEDAPKSGALGEFHVLRAEARLEERWCEECPERLERLDVLKIDRMDNFVLLGDRFVYQDEMVSYGHVYMYRVVSVTGRGYESALSNRAVVFWDTPPDAPRQVEGTAQDMESILRWDGVPQAEGYRIYRKQQGRDFGDAPVAVKGPDQLFHRDRGLSNGMLYHYEVRAIRRVGRTWVEGPGSEQVSLTPRDLRPPVRPKALVAIPLAEGIELSWQRNPDPDLLGYAVYRREPEGAYRRLNDAPLEAPLYLDETAILGKRYEYVVTAVDLSPDRNESPFSESVSVLYIR